MTEPTQPPKPEELPVSGESDSPTPAPGTPPNLVTARVRGPLPSSPLERAKLESQGQIPQRSQEGDRSTIVAFGLLFVVPLLIIVLSVLLLLPFINAQMTREADPGGARVQTGPGLPPPRR